MTVIGAETILNYKTTVARLEIGDARFTEWFAPELRCISLRSTSEKAVNDGAFRMAYERRALNIVRNSSAAMAQHPNRKADGRWLVLPPD